MGGALMKDVLVVVVGSIIGALAAQWLVNNSRTVRRAVGGL